MSEESGANADTPIKVAAIFTILRFRSHAYNILENFFAPYLFSGKLVDPGVQIVSMYADQNPDAEMVQTLSQKFGVPLYDSIDRALCCGGKQLAVDAVLSIGEHGDYPTDRRGVVMYPRKRFFDESVAVMKRSNRFVPFFNDKHLSYRWDWSQEMYDTSRKYRFPLMAGSSVPLAERRPSLELPKGAELDEAISIHGGGIESYDFHALEVLQSMIERRRGGETGIESVQLISGDAYQDAARNGLWSQDLVDAAMAAEEHAGTERRPWPEHMKWPASKKSKKSKSQRTVPAPEGPHAILLNYRDGMRATILKVGSSSNRWNFACRLKGDSTPQATSFYNGPWGNRCLFKALSHAIQVCFREQREPYPVERTLLVSGILPAAMESHENAGSRVETPQLALSYQPVDDRPLRETGATWKMITLDTPQPTEFSPGDAKLIGAP